MSKLKVLMLGWEFPPVVNGGLGVACLGMAKALSNKVDLTLILPKADTNFVLDNVNLIGLNNVSVTEIEKQDSTEFYKEFEEVSFIETDILPYDSEPKKVLSTKENTVEKKIVKEVVSTTNSTEEKIIQPFQLDNLYGNDIGVKVQDYARYILNLAKDKEFDIIHAHDWMTFLAGVELKKLTGKPLAVHVHSLSYDRNGPLSESWIQELESYGMNHADMVIPVSKYTGEVIVNHYGIDRSKVFPVHNGVELEEVFTEKKSFPEKLVLFLGRVTLQKGPELFLEIASKVLEKHDNVRFVMAGTGDKLKEVIESGAYKKVGDKFHFTGFLNKDKVNRLYAMADVYCMPSISEPFGLSALEATQFGVPAVISKQSGVAEVLTGALMADFWDVDTMAKHVVKLIDDDKLKDKVVSKSQANLKALTWDSNADKLLSLFDNFINA